MKCNEAGLDIIRECEGLRLKAYQDTGGVWTIGYGRTKDVNRHTPPITEEIAERLLLQDVAVAEKAVRKVVFVPLNENQFSALVSFFFNLGETQLRTSKSIAVLNRRQYLEFADRMLLWNKDNGRELPGLTKRRQMERALFLTPVITGGKDFA